VTHSGNDWQARNNLRNLEVSASSITAKPKDLMAYEAAVKHDTNLQGGSTTADVANLAAANRHNEINSIAQVANARTAQQGQQFGASHDIAKQRLALDNRKADIADTGAQMDNATKKQLQDLNAQILKETDPAKLAVLQDKAQTITGKYQRQDPAVRMTVVPQGSYIDEKTQQVLQKPSLVLGPDGQVIGQQQAQQSQRPVGTVSDVGGKKAVWNGSKWIPQ